jgi:hypothetical protein
MRLPSLFAIAVAVILPFGAVAAELLLTAQYSPGLSPACGWKAKIDDAGKLTRYLEPKLATGKCDTWAWPRPRLRRVLGHSQLSPAQMNELRRAIAAADPPTVPSHAAPGEDCQGLPYIVSDEDELSIELAGGTGTKRSGIYAWREVLTASDPKCPNSVAAEVRRFLSVWVVILRAVGSPNAGDTAEQFDAVLGGQQ